MIGECEKYNAEHVLNKSNCECMWVFISTLFSFFIYFIKFISVCHTVTPPNVKCLYQARRPLDDWNPKHFHITLRCLLFIGSFISVKYNQWNNAGQWEIIFKHIHMSKSECQNEATLYFLLTLHIFCRKIPVVDRLGESNSTFFKQFLFHQR